MKEFLLQLFKIVHVLVLAFLNDVGVFAPPLVNATLLGFGFGFEMNRLYGIWGGLIGGVVMAVAIEGAGVHLSRNQTMRTRYFYLPLYIACSWAIVWFGLRDGWMITMVGTIMPLFVVAIQMSSAQKEAKAEEQETLKFTLETTLATKRLDVEERKQEASIARAEARQARATMAPQYSREDALEFLRQNPEMGATEAAAHLGIARQTVYKYRDLLSN